ncbi:MAG: DUF3465 domain-containing protein [Candidatus Obscuribacterales bacterium]
MHSRIWLQRFCLATFFLVSCSTMFSGCTQSANNQSTNTIERPPSYTKIGPDTSGINSGTTETAASIDEAQVAAAQNNRASHVSVTCTLPVKRMLRPDDKGEKHEKFLLQLSNGTTILVAHNVSRAPSVPVEAGDIVTVHGEYIWNEKGGVIHWTHASDTPRHEGGYIDFKGRRYQ